MSPRRSVVLGSTLTTIFVSIVNMVSALTESFLFEQRNVSRRPAGETKTVRWMVDLPEETSSAALLQSSCDKLPASQMARSIRKYRSSRGRTDSDEAASTDCFTQTRDQHGSGSRKKSGPRDQPKTDDLLRRRSGVDLPYYSAIKALRAYSSLHGNLVIPRRYRVPYTKDYANEWHGVDLSTIYDMKWWQRNVKSKPDRVAELNQLGFVWERLQPEWNLILEALITYRTLYGNLLVPSSYVVPQGDNRWSKATWKIPLGNCVYRIRSRSDFLRDDNAGSRRDQLDGLGFVWDAQERRYRIFYAALRHYAKLEKCGAFSVGRSISISIPSNYIVPSEDLWPNELWGYPLGAKCIAVRQKDLYVKDKPERKQMLQKLGFHWGGNADLGWLRVVHAAAIYSRMHDRYLDVPYHFKVPAPSTTEHDGQEWPWPEHLWGLPLGQRLKDVRTKDTYLKGENAPKRRNQLDALGFVWKPKQGRKQSKKG